MRWIWPLVLSLTLSPAHADNDKLIGAFKASIYKTLNGLEKAGIQKIHHMSVAALRAQLARQKFVVDPTFRKFAGATRWSAFVAPHAGQIYLHPLLSADDAGFDTLATHELLMGAAFSDGNYDYSTLIVLTAREALEPKLSFAPHLEFMESAQRFLENPPRLFGYVRRLNDVDLQNARLSLGSGTLVGSGGDVAAAAIKQQIVNTAFSFYATKMLNNFELMDLITRIEVEVKAGLAARELETQILDDGCYYYRFFYPTSQSLAKAIEELLPLIKYPADTCVRAEI
jgi:hypothetical protein